ncbi:MAG: bifunctional nuclease family protein [Sedimentisphaerales bacterium]|nr:bifunctional nuclease family protein [Sedimentisphaerales bacterium]
MEVEMELCQIIIQETTEQQIIVLRERNGERAFPIVIGIAEALAIDRRLKGIQPERPLTHDLLFNIIAEMDGQLERIEINDLRDHTFYAKLIINKDGQEIEIDSRPSDAIALGAANSMPIYVAEHVIKAVC